MPIRLVAGLGNPGAEYEHTRHNTGADLVTAAADRLGIRLQPSSRFLGLAGSASVAGSQLHLLLPTTYMNLSGRAVAALAGFYKIPPEEILVVHDELDLEPGQVRLKLGGGHAGHNGLKSIISCLGNCPGFYRLRLGIGKPSDRSLMIGYVLGRPTPSDRDLIADATRDALDCLEAVLADPQKAMNRINSPRTRN